MTFQLHQGDCLEVMQALPDNSVHSIVTDPPYGLVQETKATTKAYGRRTAPRGFNGALWDGGVPGVEVWEQCLRILKPGGHLLSFAGARTYHRMAVNIEDAGFEIRDQLMWVYSTGYPKSRDIAKTLDARRFDREDVLKVTAWLRSVREAKGISCREIDAAFGLKGMCSHWTTLASQPSVPTLEQVPKLLEVLGLRLEEVPDEIRNLIWTLNGNKGTPGPNWERREVVGTALMTDTSRVRPAVAYQAQGAEGNSRREVAITKAFTPEAQAWEGWGTSLKPCHEPIVMARKPLGRIDGQPQTIAGNCVTHGVGALNIDASRFEGGKFPGNLFTDGSEEVLEHLPKGGARFFYSPKATKADRGEGNTHPTVKPTELMRYLCALVTPEGGVVLDPFMGSGSTGKAATLGGFDFVGIELSGEYLATARSRVEAVAA